MELLEKIYNAGIVGAGGAGFPTHIKLNAKVDYFIINAMECEPLLQSDKYIMRQKSDEIIKAVDEIGKFLGTSNLVIALKEEYEKEIEALNNSIQKFDSKIKLHLTRTFYPAGDEQVLIYEVTGRVVPPGGIPLNVNTVVSNVGTVFNIYEAMNDKPVTYKFVTVIGEVAKPSIIKVPIGTSVVECIDECGGVTTNPYAVIMGGPMMGRRFSSSQIKDKVITKTDGAIMVLPEDHYLIQKEKIGIDVLKQRARAACIQCSFCSEMCPRNLIGHPINPHKIMRTIAYGLDDENTLKQALICCECGVCEMYACPMGLSPKTINKFIKNELRQKGIKWNNECKAKSPKLVREYRKVPTERLIQRLKLQKYKGQNLEEGMCLNPSEVKIPLKQNIGISAKAIVNVGDTVEVGQMIGKVDEKAVGANIHSSITGVVTEVSDCVVIKAT